MAEIGLLQKKRFEIRKKIFFHLHVPETFLCNLDCSFIFIENEFSAGGTENYCQERMISSGVRISTHFMFLLFTYYILPLFIT